MYFSANCIWRSSLDFPVTLPKEPFVGSVTGLLQLGWFKISNSSKRNCSICFSKVGKFLRRLISQAQKPGPRSELRGCLPKVPGAGMVNAEGSNQLADEVNEVTGVDGSPVRFQNWFPLPGPTPAISALVRTDRGIPDWNWFTPEISQPPRALCRTPRPPLNIGSSYI